MGCDSLEVNTVISKRVDGGVKLSSNLDEDVANVSFCRLAETPSSEECL